MGMMNEEREKHIRIANMLIGVINDVNTPMLMYQIEKDVAREALENYVKMLEQQPCDDCISRAEAINVVHKYFMDYLKLNDDICLDGIRSLPSVTSKPKVGRWEVSATETLDGQGLFECSSCGYLVFAYIDNHYCPNCGAKMKEGGNDDE